MKQQLLLTAILMTYLLTSAQQKPSCHSTEAFASFAKEESFRNEHQEPSAYTYTGAGEMVSFQTYDGKEAKAFLIKAEKPTNNYLFVFHEWWGLNDLVKKQAAQFQTDLKNINVLVIDLYDGKVTDNREEAGKLMGALDTKRAEAIISGAVKYAGKTARIFTVGWCLGGGWSLQASLIGDEQTAGCIVYYGMPETSVPKLKTLHADVLGIFASKDAWITQDIVKEFAANMKAAGKRLDIVSFDADHAFANPSNSQFDKEATEKAYKYSVDFIKERL
ncbi:MAG: dienelactone hydrolase family protein [Chitinophagales bacterium]|nr:dienelactone hydrolase family protein [Chitinophagales bacterium]